jgi:hypothetical protein
MKKRFSATHRPRAGYCYFYSNPDMNRKSMFAALRLLKSKLHVRVGVDPTTFDDLKWTREYAQPRRRRVVISQSAVLPRYSSLTLAKSIGYNAQLVRYADDIVIFTVRGAPIVLGILAELLSELGLRLKAEKTGVTNGRVGFDFLSFHFMRRFQKRHGKEVTYFYPSKKAAKRFRSKVRELTKKSIVHLSSVEQVIENLNLLILGWSNYFHRSTHAPA